MSFLDLIKSYFNRVVVLEIQNNRDTEYISVKASQIKQLKNYILINDCSYYSTIIPKQLIISMEVL